MQLLGLLEPHGITRQLPDRLRALRSRPLSPGEQARERIGQASLESGELRVGRQFRADQAYLHRSLRGGRCGGRRARRQRFGTLGERPHPDP